MKQVLLFIFLCFSIVSKAKVYVGWITLTNQDQINSFRSVYNCDTIMGNLSIYQNGLQTTIVNLDSLIDLKFVAGGFSVNTTKITNINGLQNLKRVDGSFSISYNTLLTSINLPNLRDVGSTFRILNNDLLTSLKADSLQTMSYYVNAPEKNEIQIINNPSLTTLNTFKSLIRYTGIIEISNNILLSTIGGFDNLRYLTGLTITKCNASNLNGLNNIDSISVVLFEFLNETTNIDGLGGIQYINRIKISNCNKLRNLNGISHFTKFDVLDLVGLPSLQNFSLPNLTYINIFNFNDCDSVTILGNLGNIERLPQITIQDNKSLTSITAFQSLIAIYRYLTIKRNPVLTDVSGFYNLEYISSLAVTNNYSLNACCFFIELKKLGRMNTGLTISENGPLCSDIVELLAFDCNDPDYDQKFVNDNCEVKYNPNQEDSDSDGIGDTCDNCPITPNYNQVDSNQDGIGDVCSTAAMELRKNVEVQSADIYVSDPGTGLIMKSPNGFCYRVSIDMQGNVYSRLISCP
jgi:hypothetical protein